MKKSISLPSLAAVSLTALFAACSSTEEDPQTLLHEYHGRLSDLTKITDYSTSRLQWMLPVDTASQAVLRGECTWKGYLGDSTQVTGQTATPGMYTNEFMTGKKKAAEFRNQGVILSRDTLVQGAPLTHYRVDFKCEY
jgi:hypothetical protein